VGGACCPSSCGGAAPANVAMIFTKFYTTDEIIQAKNLLLDKTESKPT